jgi:uncharacterized protein (TIGR02145 family)
MKEIKLDSQIWMVENLNVGEFRNGETIQEAKTSKEWAIARKEKSPAWCYYNFDPENGRKYGRLYNWYAVNDFRGLAPEDWHIPTITEWEKLIEYLGGLYYAGKKMKSKEGWKSKEAHPKYAIGDNESGFTALPGGCLSDGVVFKDIEKGGYWWSSADYNSGDALDNLKAWHCYMQYISHFVSRAVNYKSRGLSVRCVKDL